MACNARTTAAVKARLSKELGLSALADISVDTTDGLVTLSGSVPNDCPEHAGGLAGFLERTFGKWFR